MSSQQQPPGPRSTQPGWTWVLGTLAVVFWGLTIAAAIADVMDHFPRGLVVLAAALAIAATATAAVIGVGCAILHRLDRLEAASSDEAFDVGRRYQEAVSRTPRIVRGDR